MHGAVSPPSSLPGLRPHRTRAYRLLRERSLGTNELEGRDHNGARRQHRCCQCLRPQGELQSLPASPGDSPRSAGRTDPGSSQITAFVPGPGVCEIFCVPFKREISISLSPLGLQKVRPTGLQSQMLWGPILPVQDYEAGEPEVGLRPLIPLEEPLQCNYFWGRPPRSTGLDYITPPTRLVWFLLHVFGCRSFFGRLWSFSLMAVLMIVVLVCPEKEVSLGAFSQPF